MQNKHKHLLTTLLVMAFAFLLGSSAQAQKYDKAGIKAAIVNAGIPENDITQDIVDKYYNYCLSSMDNEDKFENEILPQLKKQYEQRLADEQARQNAQAAHKDSIEQAEATRPDRYKNPDYEGIATRVTQKFLDNYGKFHEEYGSDIGNMVLLCYLISEDLHAFNFLLDFRNAELRNPFKNWATSLDEFKSEEQELREFISNESNNFIDIAIKKEKIKEAIRLIPRKDSSDGASAGRSLGAVLQRLQGGRV